MQNKQVTNDTIYPSEYVSASNCTTQNTGNFLNPVTNGNYARFQGTASTDQVIIYAVDCSAIPATAVIRSISCEMRCYVNNTTRVSAAKVGLYAGNTLKSNEPTFLTTTNTNRVTMTSTSFSRADLNSLRIQVNTTTGELGFLQYGYSYLYGATFTIVFTVNFYKYTLTIHNGTHTCEIQPDVDDIMEGTAVEHSFTATNPNVLKRMTLNGSPFTPTKVGDHYEFTRNNVTADYNIEIMNSITPLVYKDGADKTGTAVYRKVNGTWQAVPEQDWNEALNVDGDWIAGW